MEKRIYYVEEVHRSNEYRLATEDEIEEALRQQFKNRLERDETTEPDPNCNHWVWWDEDGFMYTFRHCLACGVMIEMI